MTRVVIPSESSDSRDLHLGVLTESTESTEPGAAICPPDHQNHFGLWMERSAAPVHASRTGKQFSVLSVLSVRNERHQAIRLFPRTRRYRSAFRRWKACMNTVEKVVNSYGA